MLSRRSLLAALAALFLWVVPGEAADLQAVQPKAVRDVIHHSLVRIGDQVASGSGFLVSDDGHILTAWHVLRDINNRGGTGQVSYVSSVYKVTFMDEQGEDDCIVRATLVGASTYRDVAVLKVRPYYWGQWNPAAGTWKGRRPCLDHVRRAQFNWSLDDALPDGGESPGTYRDGYATVMDDVYPLGFPFGCQRGASGANCPLEDFRAPVKTTVRIDEDDFGLIELDEHVPPGLSGGPVVRRDGLVVGMMLLRDWADKSKESISRVIPSRALKQPLWTFGIAIDEAEGMLGDHYLTVLDLMKKKAQIDAVLESFDDLYKILAKPELDQPTLLPRDRRDIAGRVIGTEYFVQLTFWRQTARVPDPDQVRIIYRCLSGIDESDRAGPRRDAMTDEPERTLILHPLANAIILEEDLEQEGPPARVIDLATLPEENRLSEPDPATGESRPLGFYVYTDDLAEMREHCLDMHNDLLDELNVRRRFMPQFFSQSGALGTSLQRTLDALGEGFEYDTSHFPEIQLIVEVVFDPGEPNEIREDYDPITITLDGRG